MNERLRGDGFHEMRSLNSKTSDDFSMSTMYKDHQNERHVKKLTSPKTSCHLFSKSCAFFAHGSSEIHFRHRGRHLHFDKVLSGLVCKIGIHLHARFHRLRDRSDDWPFPFPLRCYASNVIAPKRHAVSGAAEMSSRARWGGVCGSRSHSQGFGGHNSILGTK